MRAYRARKRAARHPPATPVPQAASDPAAAVAAWATATLQVPAGLLRGQPFALADWQVDWLRGALAPGIREAGLSVARKNGKALALTTPLPTPAGWRTMADIAAGDQVCGVDGHPCTVLAVSAVMHDRPCYRVTFSDGSRIVADADHQWVTRHTYRPWAPAPRYPGQAETVTTAQIAASVLRPRTDGTREHNHHIDVPPALEMYGTQVLPVSPYVLGVWLGDGTSTSAAITVGARDVEALQGFLIAEGVPVRRRRPRGKTAWTLTLTAGRGGPRGVSVQARLRALGVLGNKHIPAPYLDAPVADRWALLQGLMDTDGTVNRCGGRTTPRCSFSTTRRRLADEVWQLARSLGLKATKRSRPARIRGKTCGTVWEVDYPAARSTAVFRLPRKQTLLPKTLGRRSRTLAIVACEPVARVPVRCLTVDAADGMFLCGHGAIPTHNSGLVAALVLAHLVGPLRRPAWRAVVCSLTGNLAKELRRQVEEIARASGLYDAEAAAASRPPTGDRIASYQTPQPGRIVGPDGDVTCLAADKATGHAVGADLAIVDEAGLLQEKHRDLWNAMQSCMSGRAGRLLAISIRGDGPMFSELAARHADPAVHWVEYAAPDGGALDDPATWAAANPGLASGIKSLAHMQDRARAVAASPLDQAMTSTCRSRRRASCCATWRIGTGARSRRRPPCPRATGRASSGSISATTKA